jgi:hypothetical protein
MNFLSEEVMRLLVQAAENIVKEAQANLEDGTLKSSIDYRIGDDNIQIVMEEYGIFKDKGVTGANKSDFKGKKKPIHESTADFKFSGSKSAIGGSESIDKFMKKRRISSNLISDESLNYLIRRSIYQHGIKPSLFLTKPYEKYREDIIEEFKRLHKVIKKDIDGKDR